MSRIDVIRTLIDMAAAGPLTPSRLVAEATDEDHPLHGRFQWDDGRAANEFRLMQARTLLATTLYRPEGATRFIPLVIHSPSKGGGEGTYELSERIVHDPDQLASAIAEATAFLHSAEESIAQIDEVIRLFGAPRGGPERTARARRAVREAQAEVSAIV